MKLFQCDIAKSSQINACLGVNQKLLFAICIAGRCQTVITKPLWQEQVLLSSLLLVHHTHAQDPYSGADLRDNGSLSRLSSISLSSNTEQTSAALLTAHHYDDQS